MKEDEARIPKDGMAIVGTIVLVPALLHEKDGALMVVGLEFSLFARNGCPYTTAQLFRSIGKVACSPLSIGTANA